MNDRFKFRIWETDQKIMKEVTQITLDKDQTGSMCDVKGKVTAHLVYQPHYILMQSTGLKDKNGKLIYEGDIIRPYKSPEFIYRVEYDNEIFASFVLIAVGRLNMFKHYFGEAIDAEKCEVIGNIYENKSLLESEG